MKRDGMIKDGGTCLGFWRLHQIYTARPKKKCEICSEIMDSPKVFRLGKTDLNSDQEEHRINGEGNKEKKSYWCRRS